MKALTLRQPWASLVAVGAKRIETRSWSTKYRGPLAIHAAKAKPTLVAGPDISPWRYSDLPLGQVIAVTHLLDVAAISSDRFNDVGWLVENAQTPEQQDIWRNEDVSVRVEIPFGDFRPGRFAWLLSRPLRIVPVPVRGAQGLWEWDASCLGDYFIR